MHGKPFANDDLLLVAARKIADKLLPSGRPDIEPVAVLVEYGDLSAFGDKRPGFSDR
ncbi:hypothetical protein QW131_32660 [Roseibium salinum]|nr:hypothetical protein [Roseibium salinum]